MKRASFKTEKSFSEIYHNYSKVSPQGENFSLPDIPLERRLIYQDTSKKKKQSQRQAGLVALSEVISEVAPKILGGAK